MIKTLDNLDMIYYVLFFGVVYLICEFILKKVNK